MACSFCTEDECTTVIGPALCLPCCLTTFDLYPNCCSIHRYKHVHYKYRLTKHGLLQIMKHLPMSDVAFLLLCCQGFFQLFAQGGVYAGFRGQTETVWIIEGGKYVSMCKACGKLGGSGGMLSWEILILDLLIDAIWWNLGLFSHKHNLPMKS